MEFNSVSPTTMHIDINSCFATIEQQANPILRGKPVVVAAFVSPNGCILASSVDAKKLGIKTGMMVKEGKAIYPKLIVLPPDPPKYRNIHLKFRDLISQYTDDFFPKSIDEFSLKLEGRPCLATKTISQVAVEIKQRIKKEIGDYITVSVGIAPNRYLAKIGANLQKPDGLVEINKDNYLDIYSKMELTDLTGIKFGNAGRLASMGISSVMDFYQSPVWKLKAAFHSITGYYWYLRLRGYEVDEIEFGRKSYGNSVAIGRPVADLTPVLTRLVEKMSSRVRAAGYRARGIHLSLVYKDGRFWHKGKLVGRDLFDTRDFLREALMLLKEANPVSSVGNIGVSCFSLSKLANQQTELFNDVIKKEELAKAYDLVNEKWGDFTLGIAKSFKGENLVLDRIAFGGVKEL